MRVLLTSFLFTFGTLTVVAQSNIKEGNNSFALYTKTGETKHLESARKFADAAFATKKDSSAVNNNVLRGLVYSSLAVTDSTRKQKYNLDPIEETLNSLGRLNKRGADKNFTTEVAYMKRNLANALIYKANAALAKEDFGYAFQNFKRIDSLGFNDPEIKYNLALLASKSGQLKEATNYYEGILSQPGNTPNQALELAHIYQLQGNKNDALNVLKRAHQQFPKHKGILFHLIESYSSNGNYAEVTKLIEDAIALEPENVRLNYLAGYAFESEKNIEKAKKYYLNVTHLDASNYESNLALGLIYLEELLKDKTNDSVRDLTQTYLLKANEINPSDINTLKSLALYYKETDDFFQLDRVNILLNQLSNN